MLKKTKRFELNFKILRFLIVPTILVSTSLFNNIQFAKAGLEFQWDQNSGYRRLKWFQKDKWHRRRPPHRPPRVAAAVRRRFRGRAWCTSTRRDRRRSSHVSKMGNGHLSARWRMPVYPGAGWRRGSKGGQRGISREPVRGYAADS